MLVTFQSKFSRITIFGDVAVQLIRMMGRSGTVPSALLVSDIPEAIAHLKMAIDADEGIPVGIDEDDEHMVSVSLRHRALPLIELLQNAAREGSDVMWESLGSGPLQL
jgi:hypothetical protein